MYSYGPPHMTGQKQDNQHEHTFSSYVRIWNVALKTCQRWWTIGKSGESRSGISVLVARHDDDRQENLVHIYQRLVHYKQHFSFSKMIWSRLDFGSSKILHFQNFKTTEVRCHFKLCQLTHTQQTKSLLTAPLNNLHLLIDCFRFVNFIWLIVQIMQNPLY